eukprot:3100168-Rhodomonas_salina.1
MWMWCVCAVAPAPPCPLSPLSSGPRLDAPAVAGRARTCPAGRTAPGPDPERVSPALCGRVPFRVGKGMTGDGLPKASVSRFACEAL